MSWVTILWSMNAAVCLTLAGIHLTVWLSARKLWGHLLFACSAVAAAAVAACELLLMRSETVEQCGLVMRWAHVPVWLLVVSIVGFTRFHLRAGRPWLAWAAVGARTLVLVLDFLATPNINFSVISSLHHLSFWGEFISMPQGTVHPWSIVGKLSSLLMLVFLVNASYEVWRRGERRRALLLGGSMVFFVTVAAVHFALLERGIIESPYLISFAYLGTILVMAYELSREVLQAMQIKRDLQKSEAGLRESEQRMELAASAAEIGLWSWDIIGDEIWATDKARAFFGFAATGRFDLNQYLLKLHPDDREPVTHAVAKSMNGDGEFESEHRIVLPGRPVRWIAARGRVEFNAAGKPILLRGVSLDITLRKLAELEVQQQRSELAHLSRVTMLGELSGSLAHELNQPLTAILSNAQAAQRFLAHDEVDLVELREILADIVAEDKRAGEIIHRLRLLLKKGEVQYQPIDVNQLVLEVLKLVRSDLVNQGVTAKTELEEALPVLHGDRVQFQQVLLNLVMNACDAMKSVATPERQFSVRTRQTAGQGVEVSVSDCGHGIPADKLKQIFEPFFTTKIHGLGLGLSVCRTIITAHGGKLWAENNPERGATFSFTQPAIRS